MSQGYCCLVQELHLDCGMLAYSAHQGLLSLISRHRDCQAGICQHDLEVSHSVLVLVVDVIVLCKIRKWRRRLGFPSHLESGRL
eukprot:142216-Rhodomonas_salina.1